MHSLSKPEMKNRTRFVKCFIMIVDQCKSWLVVFAENRMKACSNHTTLEQFINASTALSTDPMIKLSLTKMKTSADFDISALRSIINIGNLLQSGELKKTGHAGKTIDYIDRIREIRNNFMHTSSASLVEQDYNDYLAEFRDIATRFETENKVSNGCYVKEIDKINDEPLDSEAVEKTVQRFNEYIKVFYEPERSTIRPKTPPPGPPAPPAPNVNNGMNCLTMQLANCVASTTDNPVGQVVGGIAGGAVGLAADILIAPWRFLYGSK